MIALSVVIVAFKNMDCLAHCLESIPQEPWLEVVVVNNTHQNRGFSVGCNEGAQLCKGRYLLFLNPDCIVTEKALRVLVEKMDGDSTIGIVGPQLKDQNGTVYLSCCRQPTQKTMPVVYSLLNRIFHNSKMVRAHWFDHHAPGKDMDVGVVSGAALLIPKTLFEKVGRFDESLFMYWEEVDLARRVIQAGKRVVFSPQSSMVHVGEQSTAPHDVQVRKWFIASRYYFMKKHFGIFYATMVESWFTFLEEWRLGLLIILVIALGLWYFVSGWWLNLGQVWLWHQTSQGLAVKLGTFYWLGVAGAVMGIIGFYNEYKTANTLKNLIAGLAVGLVMVFISPYGALVTVVGGLLWCTCDLLPPLVKWRKWVIVVTLASSLLLSGILIVKIISFRGFVAKVEEWQSVAMLIKTSQIEFSHVRCVGCISKSELWPLDFWLRVYGIYPTIRGKEIYVSLPPFSQNNSGIENTIRYRVGSMVLSLPMKGL